MIIRFHRRRHAERGRRPAVLANDTNTDGLPLPIKAVAASRTDCVPGTYTLNANGSFTYVPPAAMPSTVRCLQAVPLPTIPSPIRQPMASG